MIYARYNCPPLVRKLLDLVNMTVNYRLPEIISTGTSLNEIQEAIDDSLKSAKWTGVGRCHAYYFSATFRRWVWTGDVIPTYDSDWNEDYPKTEIDEALRRYNLIRDGRKMLQAIVDLSENRDAKKSVDGIKLVYGGCAEYEIEIIAGGHSEELNALDGCVARIRKCGAIKCQRFLWAVRTDTKGCSKKCSDAIRAARKRAKMSMIRKKKANVWEQRRKSTTHKRLLASLQNVFEVCGREQGLRG